MGSLAGTPATMSRIKWTLNLCDYKEYHLDWHALMQTITPTQSQIILQWETHQKSRDDVLQNTNEPKTKSELLQTIFDYQRSTTRYHNVVLELSQHYAVVVPNDGQKWTRQWQQP